MKRAAFSDCTLFSVAYCMRKGVDLARTCSVCPVAKQLAPPPRDEVDTVQSMLPQARIANCTQFALDKRGDKRCAPLGPPGIQALKIASLSPFEAQQGAVASDESARIYFSLFSLKFSRLCSFGGLDLKQWQPGVAVAKRSQPHPIASSR
jgi:hypothetical protein